MGLQRGDTLKSVNGELVQPLPHGELVGLIKEAGQKGSMVVGVQRGEQLQSTDRNHFTSVVEGQWAWDGESRILLERPLVGMCSVSSVYG